MTANTILILTPSSVEPPPSNAAQRQNLYPASENRPILSFDTTTEEAATWSAVLRQGSTGSLGIVANCIMASATSGNVALHVYIEDMVGVALATTSGWGAVNTSAAKAVPATLIPFTITLTLTNNDSLQPGEPFRIKVIRDTGVASNAAGDMHILNIELQDGL
jgi:hypothetical protein